MVSDVARPPIALMSERFCAAARCPMSVGRGPLAAEVPALDHQVGRDHDVAGLHPQHGCVVAGADQDLLALLEHRDELTDQAELAGVGQGRVGGKGHDPIPADREPARPSDAAVGGFRRARAAR